MEKLVTRLGSVMLTAALAALAGCAGPAVQTRPSLQPAAPGNIGAGKAEVLWLGQATIRITTPGGKVIVVDPWLTTNPKTPAEYMQLSALGKST
jgi:hypothetical protein